MTIVETTLMHGLLYDLPDFRDAEFLATEDTALMRQPVAHPADVTFASESQRVSTNKLFVVIRQP